MTPPKIGISAPCPNGPTSEVTTTDADNKEGVCRCSRYCCFVNSRNVVTDAYRKGKDPYSHLLKHPPTAPATAAV